MTGSGEQLNLTDAMTAFQALPANWQIASFDPRLVEIDAVRDRLLRPVHWCYHSGDERLLHSFHLGDSAESGHCDIQSPLGYGGPLSSTDDPAFVSEANDAFQEWARGHLVLAEFLRFHPLVPHARWYPGNVAFNRDTVVIDLCQNLFSQYAGRRRTDVRRIAEEHLRIDRVSPSVMTRIFPQMYLGHMERIDADQRFRFTPEYFESLLSLPAVENWLAYDGDAVVAGAVVLTSSIARVAEYHLGAHEPGGLASRATIALLHAAATHYQQNDFERFYLGGGRSTASDDSLLFFKKGFSPLTVPFQIGTRVYAADRYQALAAAMPEKAGSGRVLFYRD